MTGFALRRSGSTIASLSDAELLVALCGPSGRALAKRPLPEIFGLKAAPQAGLFVSEDVAPYVVNSQVAVAKELYTRALHAQLKDQGIFLDTPQVVRDYLCSKIGGLEYEVFWVLFLDAQNRLIAAEEMFRGTLTQTSVYPREVVKRALALNASIVMLAHNHPSGVVEPSRADEAITRTLKTALQLVDVRVLDHVIVGGNQSLSFAERGLI